MDLVDACQSHLARFEFFDCFALNALVALDTLIAVNALIAFSNAATLPH